MREELKFEYGKLRDIIKEILNKRSDDPVYKDEVESITKLDLSEKKLESIGGLEYFINLVELDLFNNTITDLKPLKNLISLKKLDLFSNRIMDISPLVCLYNLKYLYIADNKIPTICGIENLLNLEELNLSNNPITDICPISGLLKLRRLDLQYCELLKNVYPISNLDKLSYLGIPNNSSLDLSILEQLPKLTELDIDYEGSGISNDIVKKLYNVSGLNRINYDNVFINGVVWATQPNLKRWWLEETHEYYGEIYSILTIYPMSKLYWEILYSPEDNDENIHSTIKDVNLYELFDFLKVLILGMSRCKLKTYLKDNPVISFDFESELFKGSSI